jgi:hypothetical protein
MIDSHAIVNIWQKIPKGAVYDLTDKPVRFFQEKFLLVHDETVTMYVTMQCKGLLMSGYV